MSLHITNRRAFITGISGLALTTEEKNFIQEYRPLGYILFARNVENPEQVLRLTAELQAQLGENSPILIDQEGGRVARLKPPHWPVFPSMQKLVDDAENKEAASFSCYQQGKNLGAMLKKLGINVDCAPVLDLRLPNTHAIIGDRSPSADPELVAHYGEALARGLMEEKVFPIIKHIPGHGRATLDSHEDLPIVDVDFETLKRTDFLPFKLLAHLPLAMTAHIIYTALDAKLPATLSPIVIRYIRDEIGFSGWLMSDDVSMKALRGSIKERVDSLFAAGCDIALHCNGEMAEMLEVAEASPIFNRASELKL